MMSESGGKVVKGFVPQILSATEVKHCVSGSQFLQRDSEGIICGAICEGKVQVVM